MCVYNCLGDPLGAAGHGKQQEADFEAGWLATGAGKTQLLAALKDGHAVMDEIGKNDIELYDMVSFRVPNCGSANRNADQFAKVTADKYLLSRPGERPPIEVSKDIFEQCADDIEHKSGVEQRDEFACNLRGEIRGLSDFSVFPPDGDRVSPYKKALYEDVMARLVSKESNRRSSNQSVNSFNGNQAALLSAAMKLTGKLPHEQSGRRPAAHRARARAPERLHAGLPALRPGPRRHRHELPAMRVRTTRLRLLLSDLVMTATWCEIAGTSLVLCSRSLSRYRFGVVAVPSGSSCAVAIRALSLFR